MKAENEKQFVEAMHHIAEASESLTTLARNTASIGQALVRTLESVNVRDSNGEPANAVDTLQRIANGAGLIGEAGEKIAEAILRHSHELHLLTDAIERMRPVRNPASIPLPN